MTRSCHAMPCRASRWPRRRRRRPPPRRAGADGIPERCAWGLAGAVGSKGRPPPLGGRRQRRHEVRTPWPSASSTSSRSASARPARTRSGRCARPRCSRERLQHEGRARHARARVASELFGSLGATGAGHGSDKAVLLGPGGRAARHVDADAGRRRGSHAIRAERAAVAARRARDRLRRDERPGAAPAQDAAAPPQRHALHRLRRRRATRLASATTTRSAAASSSTRTPTAADAGSSQDTTPVLPHPFHSGDELLAHCKRDRPVDRRS